MKNKNIKPAITVLNGPAHFSSHLPGHERTSIVQYVNVDNAKLVLRAVKRPITDATTKVATLYYELFYAVSTARQTWLCFGHQYFKGDDLELAKQTLFKRACSDMRVGPYGNAGYTSIEACLKAMRETPKAVTNDDVKTLRSVSVKNGTLMLQFVVNALLGISYFQLFMATPSTTMKSQFFCSGFQYFTLEQNVLAHQAFDHRKRAFNPMTISKGVGFTTLTALRSSLVKDAVYNTAARTTSDVIDALFDLYGKIKNDDFNALKPTKPTSRWQRLKGKVLSALSSMNLFRRII